MAFFPCILVAGSLRVKKNREIRWSSWWNSDHFCTQNSATCNVITTSTLPRCWLLYCWLVRVSLFIELGGAGDLGTRKRGAFSSFMINRPILHGSDWWKFWFWNGVTWCIQSSFRMQMSIKGARGVRGARGSRGVGSARGVRDTRDTKDVRQVQRV